MWKKVESLVNDLFYLKELWIKEGLKHYIQYNEGNKDRDLFILVNGPSLKNSLCEIRAGLNDSVDVMTVNFMTNEDLFEEFRPKYHVISDMMFYNVTHLKERVDAFFENINKKADWPITLFVPYKFWKDKIWLKRFYNERILVQPFHSVEPPLNKNFVIWAAKHHVLGCDWGTVLHHCIMCGMYLGYKKILLYGADHTFFDGLCVNKNNQVCKRTAHFYDSDVESQKVFNGHDCLRVIADALECDIINKTPVSMIDSYLR